MTVNEQIGKKIQELRKEKGLTQTEFGNRFKLSQNAITNIEKGKRDLKIDELLNFASFFNVSTDYLIKENGVRGNNPVLQYICDYTGLSEKAIRFLALMKNDNFVHLIDFYLSENFNAATDIYSENYIEYLIEEANIGKNPEPFKALIRAINLSKEINALEETTKQQKDSLKDDITNQHSDDNYIYIEDNKSIMEKLALYRVNITEKGNKEEMLIGTKYFISKDFETALDKFIEMKAGEEND